MFAVNYPDLAVIIVFSIIVSAVNLLTYRFIGNYEAMKKARAGMKRVRERAKEKGKMDESDIEEMSKHQSEYMRHSMKPMIVSIAIFMIIFPLFTRYVGDVKLVNGTASIHGRNITLSGENVLVDGKPSPRIFSIDGRIYEATDSKISPVIFLLPVSLPIFGRTIGWLFTYIIAVLIINTLLRRITGMGV